MTTTEQMMVVGLFDDHAQAEQAVNALEQAGFPNDQISFSGHGASTGGFLAGLKSLFSGQGTTERADDDLVAMGMPQEDASYYQQEYEAGRSVVAVTGGSRMQEAAAILTQYGAYGANRRPAQTTDTDATTPSPLGTVTNDVATRPASQEILANTEEGQRIQVREEQLQVYKRPVQTGEVGLRKEVVSEQQTINVPVNREEVYLERHVVDQPVPADTPISEQDEVIQVPVSEERVNVGKQTVVREEINLGKRTVQETRQVKDTVRREKARVERKGDVPIHNTKTDPFHPSNTEVEDLLEDR